MPLLGNAFESEEARQTKSTPTPGEAEAFARTRCY